jgi:hypothetical protein
MEYKESHVADISKVFTPDAMKMVARQSLFDGTGKIEGTSRDSMTDTVWDSWD